MATDNRTATVARIRDESGKVVGTGVLVSERHVLTCAHVVNDALGRGLQNAEQPPADTVVTLDFPVAASGKTVRTQVVKWEITPETADIAGLELLDPLPSSIPPARLKRAGQGASVTAFGFPKGYPRGLEIPATIAGRVGGNWLQMNTTDPQRRFVSGGFSGGPVWASDGSGFIGITAESDSEEIAYCIPGDVLAEQWKALKIEALDSYRDSFAPQAKDANLFCGRELNPLSSYSRLAETTFILPTHKDIFVRWLQVRAKKEAGIGVIPSLKHYHHAHLIPEPSKYAIGEKDFGIWRDVWNVTGWARIPFVHISIIPLSNHPDKAQCEVWVARLQPHELINKQPAELTIWETANNEYDNLIADIRTRWVGAVKTSSDYRPNEWRAWKGRLSGKPPQKTEVYLTPQNDLKALIQTKERRLHHLKLREAQQGYSTDPSVLMEIENIEAELRALRAQLE